MTDFPLGLIWYVMRDRVTRISNLYGDPYSLITHSSGPKPRGMGYEGVDCTAKSNTMGPLIAVFEYRIICNSGSSCRNFKIFAVIKK